MGAQSDTPSSAGEKKRFPNMFPWLQALANIALVIVAVMTLKLQADTAGLQGFFQSEIEARNDQIADVRRQYREASDALADIRRQAAEAQAQLAHDLRSQEQAEALTLFRTGLAASSFEDSELLNRMRDSANAVPEATTLGAAQRVRDFRRQFLQRCSASIRPIRYDPPPITGGSGVPSAFGQRTQAVNRAYDMLRNEIDRCIETLPAYRGNDAG